ncbi:MAG: FAD:protein FMN transferase [Acidiferrobacterales bacterium]
MRLVILLVTSLALVSCNQDHRHVINQSPFNYDIEIVLYSTDRDLARRAIEAVTNDLNLIADSTDPQKAKPMSRTNALLQSGEWYSANPSLYELIKQSQDYFQKTGGVFNPAALGALRQAWGFYQATPKPDFTKINDLLKQDLTMKDIEIKGIRVRGRKADLKLDFDLLAIGYAIDSQLEHMEELGIRQAALRIGPITGTLGNVPQSIALDSPEKIIVLASGEAMCRFSARNSRFPDLGRIDPRSAWPVKPIPAIAVIHNSARSASVACATLSVAGEAEWEQLIFDLGLVYAWRRGDDYEQITPAMRARLEES